MVNITICGYKTEITRKKIKNIRMRIADGKIKVSAPKGMSEAYIENFVLKNKEWAESHIKNAADTPKLFDGGKVFRLFDKIFDVEYSVGRAKIVFNGEKFLISIPEGYTQDKLSDLAERWYKKIYLEEVQRRLPFWESISGLHPNRIAVMNCKTRWGVCYSNNKLIKLNVKLAVLPKEYTDYVLIHELCHLKEPNHGEGFKKLLTHYYPCWREIRKELNKYVLS